MTVLERVGWRERCERLVDKLVLDNPIVLRELSQRLGGGRLALGIFSAGVLQGAAICLAFSVFLYEGSGNSDVCLGEIACFYWGVSLLVFALFSAPNRAAGLFDWERRKESLDQHITSGSSPLVTIRGKLVFCGIYAAEIAISALPFATMIYLLGGVEVSSLAAVIACTMAYSFALLGLFIWGAMIEPEAGVLVGLTITAILGMMFTPLIIFELPAFAPLTPVFPIVQEVWAITGQDSDYLRASLFGHPVSGTLICFSFHLALGLLGLSLGALGPRPIHGEIASTYGTLIADRHQRFRRFAGNFLVRRRSDLRFLYQNRAGFLQRHESDLRNLHDVMVALIVLVLALGLSWNWWGGARYLDEQVAFTLTIAAIIGLFMIARSATCRDDLAQPGGARMLSRRIATSALIIFLPVTVLACGVLIEPGGMAPPDGVIVALLGIGFHALAIALAGTHVSLGAATRFRGWFVQAILTLAIFIGLPYLISLGMNFGFLSNTTLILLVQVSLTLTTAAHFDRRGELVLRIHRDGDVERITVDCSLWTPMLLAALVALLLGMWLLIRLRRAARRVR